MRVVDKCDFDNSFDYSALATYTQKPCQFLLPSRRPCFLYLLLFLFVLIPFGLSHVTLIHFINTTGFDKKYPGIVLWKVVALNVLTMAQFIL